VTRAKPLQVLATHKVRRKGSKVHAVFIYIPMPIWRALGCPDWWILEYDESEGVVKLRPFFPERAVEL